MTMDAKFNFNITIDDLVSCIWERNNLEEISNMFSDIYWEKDDIYQNNPLWRCKLCDEAISALLSSNSTKIHLKSHLLEEEIKVVENILKEKFNNKKEKSNE